MEQEDDDDIEISLPTQGMHARGAGGGGGGMFGPNVDYADLDSQFNSMLSGGNAGHQVEDEDIDTDLHSTEQDHDAPRGLGDEMHLAEGNEEEDFAPPVSLQKAPSPPKPPVKQPSKQQPAQGKSAGGKPKKTQASKTASDTDLDSFISKMDPNNAAKLNTDDDVLEKKLALLRQRSSSGVLDVDRSAPPSKEDINHVSPQLKPPARSSPQKTVLTAAPKPIVSKKISTTEDKPKKSTINSDSRKESYRGEAEINRMMGLNDDDLLKKTKELELQMKSIAAAAKKNKAVTSSDHSAKRNAATKTLTYEEEETRRKEDRIVQRSAAAPAVVSPFDPKKAEKQYRNKNRPPAKIVEKSAPPSKKTQSLPADLTAKAKTTVKPSPHEDDPWKKKTEESDEDDDVDDVDSEDDGEKEGKKSALAREQEKEQENGRSMATHAPAIERAEPTVLSPSSKAFTNRRDDMEHEEEEEEEEGQTLRDEEQEEGGGDDSDEEDSEEQRQVDAQVKSLRMRAVELEQAGQYDSVEETLLKALELNPMDMRSLDSFATFLHRKRGELGRAEAFYRRAIQVCVPSLMDELTSPRSGHDDESGSGGGSQDKESKSSWQNILDHERGVPGGASPPPPVRGAKGKRKGKGHDAQEKEVENSSISIGTTQLTRVHIVTQVLLHYATFLRRAKGDIEVAVIVLRKAADISPTDAVVLGSCAHHLVEDHMSPENIRDATDMFKRAFKNDPSNINNFLWYAKLLHKTGKLSEAELMFKVAMQKTQGEGKMGAAATCNYAMFLYKYRNKIESADTLFKEGLEKHPRHKGLLKSYKAMLRDMKSKKMKEMPDPPRRSAPYHEKEEGVLSPVKESEGQDENRDGDDEEEEQVEVEVKGKPVKKKKESKKKEKRKSSNKPVEKKSVEEKATRQSGAADDNCHEHNENEVASDDEELSEQNNTEADIPAREDYEESKQVEHNEETSQQSDEEDMSRHQSPLPRHNLSPGDEDPSSTTTVLDRADSREGSRASSRNSSRGSSRGLKARLYERVNSAGCREQPLQSPPEDKASALVDRDEEDEEDGEQQIASKSSPKDDSDSHDTKPDIADADDDDNVAENQNDSDVNTLAINTSFGTEDDELSDDLNDEVTAPDSFTEDLEKRGVITPHQSTRQPASSSEEKETQAQAHSRPTTPAEEGGDSVEISFMDITCYDIYMFHLRSTHGDNIEADAMNKISLYWTVKVYPDTYWENETGIGCNKMI